MNRIRELREDNDILQKEMCSILNISQQQYSRYESGLSQMTYEQLAMLAKFYNFSIDYSLYMSYVAKPYPRSILLDKNIKQDFKEEVSV